MGGCPPAFSSHRFPCVLGAVVTPPHTHTPLPPLTASWGSASAQHLCKGLTCQPTTGLQNVGIPPGKDHTGWEGVGLSPA